MNEPMPELTQAELASEAARLFDVGLDPRAAADDREAARVRLTELRTQIDGRTFQRVAQEAANRRRGATPAPVRMVRSRADITAA